MAHHHHHHDVAVDYHLRERGEPLIALIGSPNVGKSTLFYRLTGRYVWASNFPGTTVSIEMGRIKLHGHDVLVVDTPGMYSLVPQSEEEAIARRVLFELKPDIVVHIVTATELERMLTLTLLLIEAGYRLVLVVNAIDEAEKRGLHVDTSKLSKLLGVPVVATIATRGKGVNELLQVIGGLLHSGKDGFRTRKLVSLPSIVEEEVEQLAAMLKGSYPIPKRMVILLGLLGDREVMKWIREREGTQAQRVIEAIERLHKDYFVVVEEAYRRTAERIAGESLGKMITRRLNLFDQILVHPITGSFVAFLVLLGLYYYVGVLGAGEVVDTIESFYEENINSIINAIFARTHPLIYELLAGEYGVLTLGLRYAIAIVLPIVAFFFTAYAVLEDTGYLPRLAALLDNIFRKLGLNGRAIIPLFLGLGCVTMATIATRVLSSRRERMIAALLLALAIPCSAQQGIVFALLPTPTSLLIWVLTIFTVMIIVAVMANKLLPGKPPALAIELPPWRLPSPRNIALKTYTRLKWYFVEVLPLFLLASVFIWLGRLTGVFDVIVSLLAIPTTAMGLPSEAATAFLYGFFRRDYGAAGLYDLRDVFTPMQSTIAAITITLFVPCIANLLVIVREFKLKYALTVYTLNMTLAFTTGIILYHLLSLIPLL